MAQFYGTVQGQRGEASRLGSKPSGLRVYRTRGSNYGGRSLIAEYREGED